jgi:3-oxoacyl-[acyl-carrier-protein] synthase-1
MSASPRIVITGTGAVCGAGLGTDAIWEAVRCGRSAIGPIRQWDASHWPARNAAEVQADNRTLVADRKLHKSITRTDLFGLCAADEAIAQSGLTDFRAGLDEATAALFNDRTGIIAGSGGGCYRNNYEFFPAMTPAAGSQEAFGREVMNCVNPMWLLRVLPNNVLCHVGIRHSFKGTNACITNHCAGGALAVAEAAAALRAGEADRMVAIGHDAPFEPETVLHFHRLGLLSEGTLRPFDAARSGTIFGEGAAAVVLETAEQAQARTATVLGEFLGSGCATEGNGILELRPDGDGLARALELALADAGVSPTDIGLIVAHGNGTQASDASEVLALRRVFGNRVPPVTGFKWTFGHLIAASATLDLVLALRALREQVAPGIATLNALDPALAPLPVSATPQVPRSDIAVVLCRGFGGMSVALIVRAAP